MQYSFRGLAPTVTPCGCPCQRHIRAHRFRLNGAFGLKLPYSPSYTGLRLILHGVDPVALEAAFRRHATSMPTPPGAGGLTAIAVDGKTLRGSFDAFNDRKVAHMMSALRHADKIALAHVMIAEKSNEIPATPELIEGLGLKDCLFTLDARIAMMCPGGDVDASVIETCFSLFEW